MKIVFVNDMSAEGNKSGWYNEVTGEPVILRSEVPCVLPQDFINIITCSDTTSVKVLEQIENEPAFKAQITKKSETGDVDTELMFQCTVTANGMSNCHVFIVDIEASIHPLEWINSELWKKVQVVKSSRGRGVDITIDEPTPTILCNYYAEKDFDWIRTDDYTLVNIADENKNIHTFRIDKRLEDPAIMNFIAKQKA